MGVSDYPRNHGSLVGLSGTDHHPQYAMDLQGALNVRPAPSRPGRWYYATDTGVTYRDTGTTWIATLGGPRRTRMPHTFAVPGEIFVPSGNDNVIPGFYVPVPETQTVTFVGGRARVAAGTSATVKVQLNDVDVAGASVVATPTGANLAPTTPTVLADNNRLGIVVTAVSGTPQNMSVTLYLDYMV